MWEASEDSEWSVRACARACELKLRSRVVVVRAPSVDERVANLAYLLGVSDEQAKEVAARHDATAEKSKEAKRKAAVDDAVEAAVAIAVREVEAEVRDVCLLAAPTGCASFQLKFGASTLHRAFGIAVGYVGPWKNRGDGRFRKMKTRMDQAKLFVMDEMSMIGRQMLGKIEFKIRNTLLGDVKRLGEEVSVAGRRVMPRQAIQSPTASAARWTRAQPG